MRLPLLPVLIVAAAAAAAPQPAQAVFSGDMSPRAESGDPDYAAGIRARQAMEWEEMIGHLLKVVDRRPWHDNAHTLLGYGYRKLGDFDAAFRHYEAALEHNPRHRGALAYMGIGYLHLDDTAAAEDALGQLRDICTGMMLTFSDGDFGSGCDEYSDLGQAIEHYRTTGEVLDLCPNIGRLTPEM